MVVGIGFLRTVAIATRWSERLSGQRSHFVQTNDRDPRNPVDMHRGPELYRLPVRPAIAMLAVVPAKAN